MKQTIQGLFKDIKAKVEPATYFRAITHCPLPFLCNSTQKPSFRTHSCRDCAVRNAS